MKAVKVSSVKQRGAFRFICLNTVNTISNGVVRPLRAHMRTDKASPTDSNVTAQITHSAFDNSGYLRHSYTDMLPNTSMFRA